MRLDRFFTLYAAAPLRRLVGKSHGVSVPVLMYHSISQEPEPGTAPYFRVNTSPAVFEQHMRILKEQGFRTINLPQLLEWLHQPSTTRPVGGEAIHTGLNPQLSTLNSQPGADLRSLTSGSSRPVVITFDDGFRNFYTHAFPILKKYGFTATMFLATAFIGDVRKRFGAKLSTGAAAPECLTWSEIREMHGAGMQFGSHTVNHPRLGGLTWKEIKDELRVSKQEIEQKLGETITTFAYPYAFPQADHDFIPNFRELLVRSGYSCCVTTEIGRVRIAADNYRLKRLPLNSADDAPLLGAKLNGAYDWLGGVQYLRKHRPTTVLTQALRSLRPNVQQTTKNATAKIRHNNPR